MRCARALASLAALALASACTLVRTYSGNELPPAIDAQIEAGRSTKADVLRDLGPPDRLVRQYDGDVFVYAYIRRNVDTLELSEPVFTRLTIFSYTRTQEKSDRMVVLFDRNGIVTGVGFRRGTEQLETF
jgi:outer membrane protein assembly factor BamE (lipoprotein component of BamABCDE complex)